MRWLWGAAVAALVAGTGCNSTCGNLEQAAKDCGTSFDSSSCSSGMSSCSDDDQKTLNDTANCEESSQVCANGAVVNGGAFTKCALADFAVSGACLQAISQ